MALRCGSAQARSEGTYSRLQRPNVGFSALIPPASLPCSRHHQPPANDAARQPEAVAASLIGQRIPADRPASTYDRALWWDGY